MIFHLLVNRAEETLYKGICPENSTRFNVVPYSSDNIYCHCIEGETGKCGFNYDNPMCDPDGGNFNYKKLDFAHG